VAGSFSLDLTRFARKVAGAGGNTRLVVKKVVLDVSSSIVIKTPVGDPSTWKDPAPPGYVGGRARGSWQYAQGAPLEQEPGGVDPTGQASINRVRAGVETGDAACEHYITSTVPYMRRLEYDGWSTQAPNGMVRITVEEFQRFINDAVRNLP
jgi:hypothetical protein